MPAISPAASADPFNVADHGCGAGAGHRRLRRHGVRWAFVAGYLADHAPAGEDRDRGTLERRLAAARSQIGAKAADWPVLVADAADAATPGRRRSARESSRRPSARTGATGMEVVDACGAGTHYAI